MVANLLLYKNNAILAKKDTMSHTLDIQHFVFATKGRRPAIPMEVREHLYRVIWNMLKERQCYIYRINGVEDHIPVSYTHLTLPTIRLV